MLLHASCVAFGGDAVILLGPPGSGKSDLVLRLIQDPAWRLVADDQVVLTAEAGRLRLAAPPALHGMLEVRGLGILRDLPVAADPPPALRLAIHLVPPEAVPRLPEPRAWVCDGVAVPALSLHGRDAAAPAKLAMALAVATGRARLAAGGIA
jgi:HPr kinase/phosphorylase